MNKFKATSLSPTYFFDKSFSKRWYKKILWLVGAVVITFLVFYGVSLVLFPNPADFEIHKDTATPQGRLLLLFRLLYDPGTVDLLTPEARTFGVVVVIVGMIVFMGMLISVASNILNKHIERYEKGFFDYKFNNHYVILGFNQSVPSLIRKIRSKANNEKTNSFWQKIPVIKKHYHYWAKSKNVILVLSEMPAEEIRVILMNEVNNDDLENVVIKNGQRTSLKNIEGVNISNALEIWVMGEADEFGHDSLNLKCVNILTEIIKKNTTNSVLDYEDRIRVNVQFDEQSTFAAFQSIDVDENWRGLIRFKASNYNDDWARKVIVKRQYDGQKSITYPALDVCYKYPSMATESTPKLEATPTTVDSPKHVHLVVFGMTQMGIAFAKRTAYNVHLPNFVKDNRLATTITFVDANAREEMIHFRNQYSSLFEIQSSKFIDFTTETESPEVLPPTKFSGTDAEFLDINFQFIQANPACEKMNNYLTELADDENTLLNIAVCYDNPTQNLNIGLNFPLNVYYPSADRVIPVFVRQFTCGDLLDSLRPRVITKKDKQTFVRSKYSFVYPFGMWDSCDFTDDEDYKLAMKVNYSYCYKEAIDAELSKEPTDTKVYFSYDKPWGDKPTDPSRDIINMWEGNSATNNWSSQFSADSFYINMRSMIIHTPDFSHNKPAYETLSIVEHNRWNMAQLLAGFHKDKLLKKKDEIRLLHPFICRYEELDEDTKDYDRMIIRMIPEMMKDKFSGQ